ncbi:vascular cell adhesion protein 1-like isoform X3 [Toxotes jaculatrix]|uniref:vascular cell adhesion protein 1-like isoform X3 n=1 Tax=Toxotes jaculatrix TaxID=941984 RepID=UPI001B3AD37D|nr:vascular cell adhesion protein 1-like isoform X3 [Toxotes jaculatrix]
MFYILWVVSFVSFLLDTHASSCDENCDDKPVFTPSRVVVKYGDSISVMCYACQSGCNEDQTGLESPVGNTTKNGTRILWTVDRMTEWDSNVFCYYSNAADYQCCSLLPLTVYKPPDSVSISFDGLSGPMIEGHQYTLQCKVQNVAPVGDLTVTFYRGQTALGQAKSTNDLKTPVSETFTLSVNTSKEDDGVQYWCEAKLELGPEGPQRPPLVKSEIITTTVLYKPQLEGPLHPDPVTITEGNFLQLSCKAVGNPSPSYTWVILPPSAPSSNSSHLTIKSVAYEQEGQYTCSVSNSVGTVTVTFTVVVKADIIPYIIGGLSIVGLLIITGLIIGLIFYYKHNRMGQYNLKDVFRLHTRHVAVPTVE